MTVERRNKELNDGWSVQRDSRHLSPKRRLSSRRPSRSVADTYEPFIDDELSEEEEKEHYKQLDREIEAEKRNSAEPYTRYFARTRLNRIGYILFYPVTMLAAFIVIGFAQVLDPRAEGADIPALNMVLTLLGGLFAFAMISNNVSRRFKDIGVTGWAGLTVAIPWIGVLIALAIAFIPGTNGPNKNGPAPPPININRTALTLAVLMGLAILAGNLAFE